MPRAKKLSKASNKKNKLKQKSIKKQDLKLITIEDMLNEALVIDHCERQKAEIELKKQLDSNRTKYTKAKEKLKIAQKKNQLATKKLKENKTKARQAQVLKAKEYLKIAERAVNELEIDIKNIKLELKTLKLHKAKNQEIKKFLVSLKKAYALKIKEIREPKKIKVESISTKKVKLTTKPKAKTTPKVATQSKTTEKSSLKKQKTANTKVHEVINEESDMLASTTHSPEVVLTPALNHEEPQEAESFDLSILFDEVELT